MAGSLDPFTIEIVKEKLHAAADEMGVVLARTSMSPIVYEVLDFACGITDADAQVVAQTNGLTLFTGTFGPQVAEHRCASTAWTACARATSSRRTSRTRAARTRATCASSSRSSPAAA